MRQVYFYLAPPVIAILILLSIEPYGFWVCGSITFALVLSIYPFFNKLSINGKFFYGIYTSFSIGIIVFHWMFNSIQNLTGFGIIASASLFILFCLVANLKIFFLLTLMRLYDKFLNKRFSSPLGIICFMILITDIITPQMFPLYWGDTLRTNDILLQSVSIGGIYTLGIVQGLVGIIIYQFINLRIQSSNENMLESTWIQFTRRDVFSIIVLLTVIVFYSSIRLYFPNPNEKETQKFNILVIQPNNHYAKKKDRETNQYVINSFQSIQSVIFLAQSFVSKNELPTWDLAVLPESAIPFFSTLASEENIARKTYSKTFSQFLEYNSKLMDFDWVYNEINWDNGYLKNDIRLSNNQMIYSKQILFPFGEYIPNWIQTLGLASFFYESSNYHPGFNEKLIPWHRKGLNILPAICYEIMYPEHIRKFISRKENLNQHANFIINLTNDSWFVSRTEAYQHLGSARVRSVENNLPLVRSTLDGVSALIDARGQYLLPVLEHNEKDFLYFQFTIPTIPEITLYSSYGWIVNLTICLFLSIISYRSKLC